MTDNTAYVITAVSALVQGVAVSAAAFFGLVEWKRSKREQAIAIGLESDRRDKEAFQRGHMHYTSYLKLAVKYPELDMGDLPLKNPPELNDLQKAQAVGVFLVWCASLQQAWSLYKDGSKTVKYNRWEGWVIYFQSFMKRENFRQYWDMYKNQFDINYVAEMESKLQRYQAK